MFFVAGDPVPQGSMKPVKHGKFTKLVPDNNKLYPWRKRVTEATVFHLATQHGIAAFDEEPLLYPKGEAVGLQLEFILPRPVSTRKTPPTPAATKRPDGDKLCRAVFDGLTAAGLYKDDSQVISHSVHKRIAEPDEPTGVYIQHWSEAENYEVAA